MRKVFLFILVAVFLILASCETAKPQAITKIAGKCQAPSLLQASVLVNQLGDIRYTPCSGRASIFTGAVDFSGATLTGVISSLNGLTATTQLFATGTSGTDFNIVSATATHTFNFPSSSALNRGLLLAADWTTFNNKATIGTGTSGYMSYFSSATTITSSPLQWSGTAYNFRNTTLNNTFVMQFTPHTTNGLFDVGIAGNNFSLDQAAGTWSATNSVSQTYAVGAQSFQIINSGITKLTNGTASFYFDSGNSTSRLGDYLGTNIWLNIDTSTNTFAFNKTTATAIFDLDSVLNYQLLRTITPAATTGAQTIDKPNGTVNFANGASTIVVTNSVANTTSTIIVTQQDTDATCLNPIVDAKAAGSFSIKFAVACTAETPVAFWVFN